MASSRRKLDLSSSSSPFASPDLSMRLTESYQLNAIKVENEIKDRIDFLAKNTSRAELEKVVNDIMNVLNMALQKIPLELFSNKLDLLQSLDKRKGTSTTAATNVTTHTNTSSVHTTSKGVMRCAAAADRSIAQNYNHIQSRKTNLILENVMAREKKQDNSISFTTLNNNTCGGGNNTCGINNIPREDSFIPVKPQPEPEVERSKLTLLSLMVGSTGDSIYTRTLRFSDTDFQTKQIRLDYFAFKSSDLNFPMVTTIFIVGIAVYFLQFDFSAHGQNRHNITAIDTVAAVTVAMTALCMLVIVINRLTLLSYRYNIKSLQRFHNSMICLMKTPYGQLADDGVLLFSSVTAALYLTAAALYGEDCNHNGVAGMCDMPMDGIQADYLVFNMIVVLFVQGFANSASRHAVVLGWVISIVSSNITMYFVDHDSFLSINLEYLMLLCVSYEFERHTLRHFVKSMLAVDISETNSRLSLALAHKRISDGEVALSSKRSVVRHVTHEVRTPLNTVAIGADVLTHELKQLGDIIPPLLMEVVVGIREASTAALEVVNELLAFEKISAGLFNVEPVQTNLLAFLRQSISQHFIPALSKNITLQMAPVEYAEILVCIDPIKMGLVMRNVLANAIKFSDIGGVVTVSVEVKGFEEGGVVVISVADTGAGMSQANISRLFQEGVQFNPNRLQNGGGSGFGLYIAKAIMELHEDGRMWAESDGEGLGCTFRMELTPLALDMYQCFSAPASELGITVMEVNTTVPLRVLVVDDSHATRKMMMRMLRSELHVCVQADNGLAAVSEITRSLMHQSGTEKTMTPDASLAPSPSASAFDIVLMDSSMPVMSGPDAAREMRKVGFTGPIIGVTGDSDTDEFLSAGADLVLVKPLSRSQLNAGIAEAFSKRALKNAARNTALAAVQLNNLKGVRPGSDRQASSGILQSASHKDSNRNIHCTTNRNSNVNSTANSHNNSKLNSNDNSESDIRIQSKRPSSSSEMARNSGLIAMDFTIEEYKESSPMRENKPITRKFFSIPDLANFQQNILKSFYWSDRDGGAVGAGETGEVGFDQREECIRRVEWGTGGTVATGGSVGTGGMGGMGGAGFDQGKVEGIRRVESL